MKSLITPSKNNVCRLKQIVTSYIKVSLLSEGLVVFTLLLRWKKSFVKRKLSSSSCRVWQRDPADGNLPSWTLLIENTSVHFSVLVPAHMYQRCATQVPRIGFFMPHPAQSTESLFDHPEDDSFTEVLHPLNTCTIFIWCSPLSVGGCVIFLNYILLTAVVPNDFCRFKFWIRNISFAENYKAFWKSVVHSQFFRPVTRYNKASSHFGSLSNVKGWLCRIIIKSYNFLKIIHPQCV